MAIPEILCRNLRLPIIVAPMFIVSGPELVKAAALSGVIGTMPSLNARSTEDLDEWLDDIGMTLRQAEKPAAIGVNLIVHRTNARVEQDLAIIEKHRVPLVITSLGAVSEIVDTVHAYGGVVFHDVINRRHSEKAIAAGVDGLILVSAGAGGHAGTFNPFALLSEIRSFFDGTLIVSGCLSDGSAAAGAIAMGADFAYMGTRFIATTEARADAAYKQMILDATLSDIVYTNAVSGVNGNFLRVSLEAAGIDTRIAGSMNFAERDKTRESDEAKAWKHIWSAGQGVGGIHEVVECAELVGTMEADYRGAIQRLSSAMLR